MKLSYDEYRVFARALEEVSHNRQFDQVRVGLATVTKTGEIEAAQFDNAMVLMGGAMALADDDRPYIEAATALVTSLSRRFGRPL
jgi:hypothetical protein